MVMPRKYDFADWFRRGRVCLVRGRHYTCGTAAMAQQVRNAATSAGLGVHVRETPRGLVVTVKGVGDEPGDAEAAG